MGSSMEQKGIFFAGSGSRYIQIKCDFIIDDIKGRPMKAIDVFGAAIKYLKDHLLDLLMKRGTEIKNADVHWVLTVPAMLTNSAKQFLREAAYKADIDGEQLSIVPKPKASSLFCQLIPTNKLHESEEAKFAITCPGTKYMILDVQERITHISVHEKQADGDLKELYEGQDGNNVYGEFYKVVIKLIGGPVWQKFIDEDECNLLDFKSDFESQIKQEISLKKINCVDGKDFNM